MAISQIISHLLSRLPGDKNEEKEKEMKQEFGHICDWMKKRLGDKVASVQISNRLKASPCVLVSGKFGWSANMERLMKAQTVGDSSSLDFMRSRRVLEINPEHPIIQTLSAACKSSGDDEEAMRAIDLLYDTALISSGFTSLVGVLDSCMGNTSGYSVILFQDLLVSTTLTPDDTVNLFSYGVLRLTPRVLSSGGSTWSYLRKGNISSHAEPGSRAAIYVSNFIFR